MIGIDVGGANVKIVDEKGAHIHYCPLWRGANLKDILSEYHDNDVAVVMSGELADGFFNKTEGIQYIVDSVLSAFPNAQFYGTDGSFHTKATPSLAAANWLASVEYLHKDYPNALLLDIGSTTADIIPLAEFTNLLGMTDTMRLQQGYLVYTGMLRTPAASVVSSAMINGVVTPFSSEYFACSGDAHYVLGHIKDAEYTTATPDGKEVSYEACLRRLARMVCADLEEIGTDGAIAIAKAIWDTQRNQVYDAVMRVKSAFNTDPILVGGIGSSVFAPVINGIDLTTSLKIPADALPAFAVRKLAESRL